MTKREIIKRVNEQVHSVVSDKYKTAYIVEIEKSRQLIVDAILTAFVTKNIYDFEIIGVFDIDNDWLNLRWLVDVKINNTITMLDYTIYDSRKINKGVVLYD